ncbi:MAG: calcium/sodium antiporter [Gemmatimonadetes bacterium]|nr:calcium/sodium antiporter [Gemmatimonadota bacterium]
MLTAFVQLIAGLVILALGGRYIVRGAVSVALLAKISTAVVGLTVVAFGTSLPELAVSMDAAARGSTDLAYANIVGSSIINIAVILAVAALIRPVLIQREAKRFEHPGMFLVLAVCLFFARDQLISRFEGAMLVAGLVAFMVITVLRTRAAGAVDHSARNTEIEGVDPATGARSRAWAIGIGYILFGIVGLKVGSDFLVAGATTVAEFMGISERIIGLTVVAMGTSLPELTTSAIAARHGEDEIALSNLLGSNIFNILAVLGLTSLSFPIPVHEQAMLLDNWIMLGFGAALFPILWTGKRVTRTHGVLLLSAFAVYFTVLMLGG